MEDGAGLAKAGILWFDADIVFRFVLLLNNPEWSAGLPCFRRGAGDVGQNPAKSPHSSCSPTLASAPPCFPVSLSEGPATPPKTDPRSPPRLLQSLALLLC